MSHATGQTAHQAGVIAFAALMLGQASQGLTFTAFNAALPAMAQSFAFTGHGTEIAQQCVTIAAFGVIAGAFASGKIVDLIGSRATILASLIVFSMAGAGGMVLQQAWVLLASRVVTGFASACMITACINTISLLFDGNARAKALGISAGMGSAASLAGLLLGGILAQRFGWRLTFIQFPVFGLAGLVLAGIGIRAVPAPVVSISTASGQTGTSLWPVYLLAIVITAIMFMGSSQLAFLLPQDGVTTATAISHIMALITAVAVPVSFAFGAIEQRLSLNGALIAGLAANTVGLALIGLVPSPPAAAAGAALMGVYVGITMPYLYHAVTLKAAAEGRAKAIGLVGAFIFLGAFLNPFVFGPLGNLLGLHGMFLAAGVGMGVMALGAARFGRGAQPLASTPE